MLSHPLVIVALVLTFIVGVAVALWIRRLEKRDYFVGPRWAFPTIFILGLILLLKGMVAVSFFFLAMSLPTVVWIGKDGWNNHRRESRRSAHNRRH